ncbi:MAG TPA: glucosaminidase domain-containing protein [Acidimicrobiales bacterium]|nr:glucosaminidase domain-containing protein [Acidimicrobiales bacterium]
MVLPLPALRRALLATIVLVTPVAMVADPAYAQTGGSSSPTTVGLIQLGTTTTTRPSSASTTAPKATTTTKPNPGTGVPAVPVGGPPTTAAPAGSKPAPPPPQPDPNPILSQVDSDLAQLTAISEYKPAQSLVSKAQDQVTAAGATLLTARQALDRAQSVQNAAQKAKGGADTQLRQLALAAYMGIGYSSPSGNGDSGNVATPGGLTGIEAADAQEMLILVGQRARQNDDDAVKILAATKRTTADAMRVYQRDRAAVSGAENALINAQQTLKVITTAATTPGAASAGDLPTLQLDSAAHPATPTTTTTTIPTGADGLQSAVTGSGLPTPVSPDILSAPQLDAKQLQAWWATLNRKPNVTVPINDLINSYAKWGQRLGVRYDLAFAQSIIETGYFSFPAFGQLTPKDNNFAGIGACDTCAHGWSFPNADTGVEAQLELLYEYSTNKPLPAGVQNVIGGTGVGGCCQTWTQLAGKWASSTVYGISIMTVYNQMLQWLIPQAEMSSGLIAPNSVAARGPELAPLPGSPPAASGKPASGKPGPTSATTAPSGGGGVSAASTKKP